MSHSSSFVTSAHIYMKERRTVETQRSQPRNRRTSRTSNRFRYSPTLNKTQSAAPERRAQRATEQPVVAEFMNAHVFGRDMEISGLQVAEAFVKLYDLCVAAAM